MLLKDGITEFLQYLVVELNRSPVTQSGYASDLKMLMSFLKVNKLERITLQELTPEILSNFIRYLSRERHCKANSLRRFVTTLKSFGSFLVNSDYLEENPAASLTRPRAPQKQPRYLQHSEVEKLFAAIDETVSPFKLRDKTIIMFMYYSGVRVTELVNVRSEDVDFNGGFIKIVKGKGGRFRKVPLHHRLRGQLIKYQLLAPQLVKEYLFCTRGGDQFKADYVRSITSAYARAAGIAKAVTPHMLRHSFATNLYTEEVDIPTLGKLLGHRGIRSTSVYIHTDLKRMRDAVNRLNTSSKLEALLWGEEEQGGGDGGTKSTD